MHPVHRKGITATLLTLALFPVAACAHNLDMDCRQINQRLEVEAFFSDDTPAREALVKLFDEKKELVATAKTDAKGKCSFAAFNPGKYEVEVDAGAGHRKRRPVRIVGTLPPPEEAKTVTALPAGGVRRAEATGFPWERAALGCGVIALIGGAWWVSRRIRNRAACDLASEDVSTASASSSAKK
jgi:hypothetical protein